MTGARSTTFTRAACVWQVCGTVGDRWPWDDLDRLLQGKARRSASGGTGRGPMVEMDLAGRKALGKRALHGGLPGRILGGLFWGTGRIRRTAEQSDRLRAGGIATPEVLAVGWRRVAGPLYAQALVTARIPDGVNLMDLLLSERGATCCRELFHATAVAVRAMHAAGFLHADLNLGNLVLEGGTGGTRLHVVDLDRGRFTPRLSRRQEMRSLARLLRSYEKWVAPTRPMRSREAAAFLLAYCGEDRAHRRDLGAALGRSRSRLRLRRLVWRLAAENRRGSDAGRAAEQP